MTEKQKKVLSFVKDNPGCTIPEIEMFTGGTRALVKTLEKNGYVEIVEKKVERNPLAHKDIEKTEDTNTSVKEENVENNKSSKSNKKSSSKKTKTAATPVTSTLKKETEKDVFLYYRHMYLSLFGNARKTDR